MFSFSVCTPLFHLEIITFLFPVFYECLLHMHYIVMGPEGTSRENPSLVVFHCEKYPSILSLNFWPVEDDRRRRRTESWCQAEARTSMDWLDIDVFCSTSADGCTRNNRYSNRGTVFSMQSVPKGYKRGKVYSLVSCGIFASRLGCQQMTVSEAVTRKWLVKTEEFMCDADTVSFRVCKPVRLV
jgi:hypothetical protein